MTHGIFVWNELYTRDVEAAKAFYAATVGWTFEGVPMPDRDQTYWIAKAEGKPAAGILDMRGIVPDGDPPHWLSYLEVDDVDRRIAEIERNGGRIVRQPFDVPDFGRIAIGLGDHETLTGRIGLRSRPSRLRHLGPTVCTMNLATRSIGAALLAARLSRIAPSSDDNTSLDICVRAG